MIIIRFVIYEDDKRIAQPIDLLPGRSERTRRLRLPDAGHFHVYAEIRKVNAIGLVALLERIPRFDQVSPELLFEVGANRLTIRDAIKSRLRIPALIQRELTGLFAQSGDRELRHPTMISEAAVHVTNVCL